MVSDLNEAFHLSIPTEKYGKLHLRQRLHGRDLVAPPPGKESPKDEQK
jgi:hypothetical protein